MNMKKKRLFWIALFTNEKHFVLFVERANKIRVLLTSHAKIPWFFHDLSLIFKYHDFFMHPFFFQPFSMFSRACGKPVISGVFHFFIHVFFTEFGHFPAFNARSDAVFLHHLIRISDVCRGSLALMDYTNLFSSSYGTNFFFLSVQWPSKNGILGLLHHWGH